jgi:outer membrane lipoprotein SlyB
MDTRTLRSALIAALLAGTALGIGHAGPSPACGIVESVREVELAGSFGIAGVVELAYQPFTADELVVRLDDGQLIRVVSTGMQLFEAGQRVQVVADWRGTRVERADDAMFFQP